MNNLKSMFMAALALVSMQAGAQIAQPARVPSTTSLAAGEIYYTLDDGVSDTGFWGTGKKEKYDAAIHINTPALKGKTVEGIVVKLGNNVGLSDFSVWLSKSLTLENKVNVPDIMSQTANVADGEVEVRFAQPYTITDGDFYAGYTVNVTDLDSGYNNYPLYATANCDSESFYVHSSRTYRKWRTMADVDGISLAMKVIIGGVVTDAAGISVDSKFSSQKGQEHRFSFDVQNHGSSEVSSVDYSYGVNGQTYTGHADFNPALATRYNASSTISGTLPAIADPGVYDVTFAIDKVNGNTNAEASLTTTSKYCIYDVLPTHRPVMEEYTGTWCGYCPRGFVGLKLMNEAYPDDFIGLSYHNTDSMEVMDYSDFPSSISGYPAAYLDRYVSVDAYYGAVYGAVDFGIKNDWETLAAEIAPAEVTVTGVLADDVDNNTINVAAYLTFIDTYTDANYHVEYVLVANDLYSDYWYQSNYYSGSTMPEAFDVFTQGDSYVYGLHFDDVVVASSRINQAGSSDSPLPAAITAYEPISTSCQFKIDEVLNTYGKAVIQDNNKLVVVALLIDDTTGHIVNADKANVVMATGIHSVANGNENGKNTYFDLSGRRIDEPTKGICIVRGANGKVSKHIVK